MAEAGTPRPGEASAWLFGHATGDPLFTAEFFRFLTRRGPYVTMGATGPGATRVETPALQDALDAWAFFDPDVGEAVWLEVGGLNARASCTVGRLPTRYTVRWPCAACPGGPVRGGKQRVNLAEALHLVADGPALERWQAHVHAGLLDEGVGSGSAQGGWYGACGEESGS